MKQAFLSLLREMFDSGDLEITDGELVFGGEVVSPDPDPNYRDDGYSHDTVNGCRSHRKIDAAVQRMSKGDKWEREIAAEADTRFCFDPDSYPELMPDDPDERELVVAARSNAWHSGGQFTRYDAINRFDFIRPGDAPRPERIVEGCAVVVAGITVTNAPARWPDRNIERLEQMAADARSRATGGEA